MKRYNYNAGALINQKQHDVLRALSHAEDISMAEAFRRIIDLAEIHYCFDSPCDEHVATDWDRYDTEKPYLLLASTIFGVRDDVFMVSNRNEVIRIIQMRLEELEQAHPLEAAVVRLRYGFSGGRILTLAAIGQQYGTSKERVRQLCERALRRFRHPFRNRSLEQIVYDTTALEHELVVSQKRVRLLESRVAQLMRELGQRQLLMEENALVSIRQLDISVRVYNALYRHGIRSISEVACMTDVQLLSIRNFREKALRDVRTAISQWRNIHDDKGE